MSLELLRRSQSWFTRGVLIVLAITFVFGFGFSISNFGTGGSVPQGTAAEVNGEKIRGKEGERRERIRETMIRMSAITNSVIQTKI